MQLIGQVNTDNVQLLNVEFNHAGNDYTEAALNIFGPGVNEVLVADEFRDGAFNYAYIDQNADATIPLGGSGYLLASNVAQSGSTTGIFLSATDGALSSAYIGMKIYIIGAAGIGQYAIIAHLQCRYKRSYSYKRKRRSCRLGSRCSGHNYCCS